MNTKRFSITGLLAVMLLSLMAVACGSKAPSAEDVARKIDAKEVLTQADYSTMIDYCGEYAKKAQQYLDIINSQPDASSPESVKATSDMAALYAEYRYLDMFRSVIDNTEESILGESNVKKVEEYAKYEAFPLPDGAGASLLDTNVVGDIEDMPASDTGSVIATGDGEVVDVQVK